MIRQSQKKNVKTKRKLKAVVHRKKEGRNRRKKEQIGKARTKKEESIREVEGEAIGTKKRNGIRKGRNERYLMENGRERRVLLSLWMQSFFQLLPVRVCGKAQSMSDSFASIGTGKRRGRKDE